VDFNRQDIRRTALAVQQDSQCGLHSPPKSDRTLGWKSHFAESGHDLALLASALGTNMASATRPSAIDEGSGTTTHTPGAGTIMGMFKKVPV
jgi:hypothetical protein